MKPLNNFWIRLWRQTVSRQNLLIVIWATVWYALMAILALIVGWLVPSFSWAFATSVTIGLLLLILPIAFLRTRYRRQIGERKAVIDLSLQSHPPQIGGRKTFINSRGVGAPVHIMVALALISIIVMSIGTVAYFNAGVKAREATLKEILAKPQAFQGKLVRIQGKVKHVTEGDALKRYLICDEKDEKVFVEVQSKGPPPVEGQRVTVVGKVEVTDGEFVKVHEIRREFQ